MLYCVNKDKVENVAGAKTAGKKAPDDITELISRLGGKRISFMQDDITEENQVIRKVRNIVCSYKDWSGLYRITEPGDVVVIQHPYEGVYAGLKFIPKMQKHNVRFVCLIHDIRSLRYSIDEKNEKLLKIKSKDREIRIISLCDAVIAHNSAMKKYLMEEFGIEGEKIYELGIFDYLCSTNEKDKPFDRSITIAGNLSESKCKYLYNLIGQDSLKTRIHLYGPNFRVKAEKVIYHGVIAPDKLPKVIEGSFGLVWDGEELDRCSGVAGEYLKYNNPHKCSLYLAAGIPVIIWKKAALASFVEENGVGITIDSLYDLDDVLKRMSTEKYREYVECTKIISKRLNSGAYFDKAIRKVMADLQVFM